MAAVNETKFKEEVKKGKLRTHYFIYGEDTYKREFFLKKLIEAYQKEQSSAVEILYADAVKIDELIDSLMSSSLWDPSKIILLKNGEKITTKVLEAISPALESEEGNHLIVIGEKADGRLKFFSKISKSYDHIGFVKLDLVGEYEWNSWFQSFIKSEELSVQDEAKHLIQEWTNTSLTELKQLIDRLKLYVYPRNIIQLSDVLAVGHRVSPYDIFQFTGALLQGDQKFALDLLERLLSQGNEARSILGLIAKQYRWIEGVSAALEAGHSEKDIARDWAVYPSAAKVIFPAAKRLGFSKVHKNLSLITEAELNMKLSKVPVELQLNCLVSELCNSRLE
ncbi:MAG: DNA polymerase III subunit delta [Oligoflexia bacterium]|nr:DNA polymerase III subunit delta [Oligoflexia bacterium]